MLIISFGDIDSEASNFIPLAGLVFGVIGFIYAKDMIVKTTALLGGIYISLGLIILLKQPLSSSELEPLIPILFIVFAAGFTFAGYKT